LIVQDTSLNIGELQEDINDIWNQINSLILAAVVNTLPIKNNILPKHKRYILLLLYFKLAKNTAKLGRIIRDIKRHY